MFLGLDGAASIDALEVVWPDGRVQHIAPPAVNQRVVVRR